MKILGVDYGSKKIGISISDGDNRMAFPKVVLQNDSKIIENFKKIISENEVKRVVLGESKNFKMIDNEIMKDILDFKEVLEKIIEVDVVMHPEVLSSIEAEQIQGKNAMSDASAATIILQSYLDLINKK